MRKTQRVRFRSFRAFGRTGKVKDGRKKIEIRAPLIGSFNGKKIAILPRRRVVSFSGSV